MTCLPVLVAAVSTPRQPGDALSAAARSGMALSGDLSPFLSCASRLSAVAAPNIATAANIASAVFIPTLLFTGYGRLGQLIVFRRSIAFLGRVRGQSLNCKRGLVA